MRGRSYAPRGQTPVTRSIGGTRQKLSMSSTVNNRGKAHWMIIDGAFNHERLIEFLQALAKEGRREGKKSALQNPSPPTPLIGAQPWIQGHRQ